jgi:hypothetical protein
MKRMISSLLVAVLAAGCVVSTAEARPAPRKATAVQPWQKLGERVVQGKRDRDHIKVGRRDGRFRRLKLVVDDSAIVLDDVVVTFGDGTRFSPRTRLIFSEDSKSRTIDLPRGDRTIRRIDLVYGNLPGGGRARVEVWGR